MRMQVYIWKDFIFWKIIIARFSWLLRRLTRVLRVLGGVYNQKWVRWEITLAAKQFESFRFLFFFCYFVPGTLFVDSLVDFSNQVIIKSFKVSKTTLVLRKTSFLYLGHRTTCKFLRVLHCCSLLFVVNDCFSCVSSLVLTSLYAFWFLFVQLLSFVCMFLIYFWDCYEYSTSSIHWLLSIG